MASEPKPEAPNIPCMDEMCCRACDAIQYVMNAYADVGPSAGKEAGHAAQAWLYRLRRGDRSKSLHEEYIDGK